MKKKTIMIGLCMLLCIIQRNVYAEKNPADSLKARLELTQNDEDKFETLFQLHALLMATDSLQSVVYGNDAIILAQKMKDEVREARIRKDMAKKYILAYEFQTYDSLITIAADLFKKHDERKLYADCINNLGASQFYRGNLTDAEKYFRLALDYYNPEDIVFLSTSLNIVIIMQNQGRYSESLKMLMPLTQKFHELGDDYNYAGCLVLMANVYNNQGDKEKAKEYNLKYIEKCKELDYKTGVAGGYYNLANLFYEIKDYNKALEYANLAKDIFELIENEYELSNTWIFIGVIYKDLGKLSESREANEQSRKIAEKNEFFRHLCMIYNNNSNLYLIEGKYAEAKELALKSYGIAVDAQNYKMIREASFNISEAYKMLGNYKNALNYYEIHTQYKDSVNHEQNSVEVQALKTNFEILTKEYENEKLKNENTLNQLEIEQQKSKLFIIGLILILVSIIALSLIYLNRKLKLKNQIISNQKDELKKANSLKDNMFSIIAHDLRGPVGNVSGLLDFLDYESAMDDKDGYERILKIVKAAASSTFVLLENLLTWARQQKNEIVFQPKSQNLGELINEVVQLKIPAAENKNISLNPSIKDEINCSFDYDMMNLVIRNLVDNAIKFTPQGGVVKISSDIVEQHVKISVTDTGVGISEDAKQKLFDKYQFFTSRGTKNEKGSGLGLKLCHEFIERHSGQIWIESTEGSGSTFTVTIPMN